MYVLEMFKPAGSFVNVECFSQGFLRRNGSKIKIRRVVESRGTSPVRGNHSNT